MRYECNLLLLFPLDTEVKISVAFKLLWMLDCCLLEEKWSRDRASWPFTLVTFCLRLKIE